jgi:hypothetical protein
MATLTLGPIEGRIRRLGIIAIAVAAALVGGAAPHPARAAAPTTGAIVTASPNPAIIGDQVALHWQATGFPNYGLVHCSDNMGWLPAGTGWSGTIYKYAGTDFASSFTWTVVCTDDNFQGSGSVDVTLDAATDFSTDVDTAAFATMTRNADCTAGRHSQRWAKYKYWQFFHLYTYWTYYERVKFCWSADGSRVTYFWRDRWSGDTNFGWSFDGHAYTNCGPVDPEHCSGKVGAYSETAITQGHYHVLVHGVGLDKYPWLTVWVHGDGGSGASWSG